LRVIVSRDITNDFIIGIISIRQYNLYSILENHMKSVSPCCEICAFVRSTSISMTSSPVHSIHTQEDLDILCRDIHAGLSPGSHDCTPPHNDHEAIQDQLPEHHAYYTGTMALLF
jgi:hypothetical protein